MLLRVFSILRGNLEDKWPLSHDMKFLVKSLALSDADIITSDQLMMVGMEDMQLFKTLLSAKTHGN